LGREPEIIVHAEFVEKGCRQLGITCQDENASINTLLLY
jgi:hypothetical protein